MAKIIDISARSLSPISSNELKEVMAVIQALFTEDFEAVWQLDDYCLNRKNKVNSRVRRVLIDKGILANNGDLPDITNEAMYILRTGETPFWKK
jgi:hypothetical protein